MSVDHDRVAQIVGCTPRACEERIKKLRKLAKECGYEVQTPTPLSTGKRGRRSNKVGKISGGKGKFIDSEDMMLYRKGIVSDDSEVKMEDGMMIKGEMIKGEFGMDGYGYGYGYEDVKPFLGQQRIEGSPFLYPGIENPDVPSMQYVDTVTSLGDLLEAPLGTSYEIFTQSYSEREGRGGETPAFKNRGVVPLKKEFPRLPNYRHLTPKSRLKKTEQLIHAQEPVEFVEISPASEKDPIIINDEDHGGDSCL